MTFVGFGGSRGARSAQAVPRRTARRPGEVAQRPHTRARPARELGAAFSILLLIMIGALAARFLVSLPNGILH
jgi:hypothetical protein